MLKVILHILFALVLAAMPAQTVTAGSDYITVGWAAWEPAHALMALSKDFTAETGIVVRGELTPWPSFQERVFAELNAKGDLYDVLIGDSQWIGAGATLGHYIELTDFFVQNDIDLRNDFAPGPVYSYSSWPKGSHRYWALPCEGDAVGWTYRKDWFERPELRRLFEKRYGYPLGVPRDWVQLRQIAEFFQERVIDGKKVFGVAIYTKRAGDGITMGVTHALYANGVTYAAPDKPHGVDGHFNSPQAVEALESYKSLYDCCTPKDWGDAYMTENLEAYTRGEVAMAMNFFAFFPGISKDPLVGPVTGYFPNPPLTATDPKRATSATRQTGSTSVTNSTSSTSSTAIKGGTGNTGTIGATGDRGATLGGQGMSIVAYSKKKRLAERYLKWFARPEVQQKWWALGGYSCHRAVWQDPGFATSFPYATAFKASMGMVRDFWQEPNYGQLLYSTQRLFHKYLVAGEGSAQGTLNQIVHEWEEVFAASDE